MLSGSTVLTEPPWMARMKRHAHATPWQPHRSQFDNKFGAIANFELCGVLCPSSQSQEQAVMPMPPSGSSEIAMTLRGVMWAVLTAANAKLWCAGCLELAKSSSKREHYPKPIDEEKMLARCFVVFDNFIAQRVEDAGAVFLSSACAVPWWDCEPPGTRHNMYSSCQLDQSVLVVSA